MRAYLASRQQDDQLLVRRDLQALLPIVAAVRHRAMGVYDFAELHRLAEPDRGVATLMEEEAQTLRALVRELEKAVTGLTAAIQAADQLEAVEGRLRSAIAECDPTGAKKAGGS